VVVVAGAAVAAAAAGAVAVVVAAEAAAAEAVASVAADAGAGAAAAAACLGVVATSARTCTPSLWQRNIGMAGFDQPGHDALNVLCPRRSAGGPRATAA